MLSCFHRQRADALRKLRWLVSALCVGALVAGCGGGDDAPSPAPATAPSVSTQPSPQSVVAPAAATFTSAAAGQPVPAVQWQRSADGISWTDIGGAIGTSYTTPATTLADTGQRLRAVFTNTAGSATSNPAILTVNAPPGVGSAGGTVTGPGGAQLVVPAGALAAATDLQINLATTGAPAFPAAGFDAAGAVYAVTPHGTAFSVPATVRIPFDPALVPAGRTPQLLKAEPGGSFAAITATVNGNFLEAAVSSLSYFGPASAPPDAGPLRFTQIAGLCGRQALTGHIWCWGSNSAAFGSGLTPPGTNFESVFAKPVRLSTRSFGSFVGNGQFACGISNGFEVWCIGDPQITGEETFPPVARWVKVALPPGVVLSHLAAGGGPTMCGIGAANSTDAAAVGRAYCWGSNASGQLGRGPQFLNPGPFTADAVVGGGADYVALGSAGSTFCAVRAGGGVECWGNNSFGQVPGATGLANYAPFPVAGVTLDAREGAIQGGGRHFCGLRTGGAVVCWGDNFNGQIGIGTAGSGNTSDPNGRSLPVTVPGVTLRYLKLMGDSTCGLNNAGDLVCWGASLAGLRPDGSTVSKQTTPLTILQGNLKFLELAGGGSNTLCGLTGSGETYCWGSNRFYDFGTGSLTPATSDDPIKIDDLGPYQSLP